MTPVFQSGTAPCSRLPRLDPISTVEDRPGGPLVAVGWNRGLRRPCQDVRMPALGVSAIDEICEHTARFRIPVDIALATWRLEAVSVSFARPLRPLARLWRPSLGVARRAIAFFFGWLGLAPFANRLPRRVVHRVAPLHVDRTSWVSCTLENVGGSTDALRRPEVPCGRWRPREGLTYEPRNLIPPPPRRMWRVAVPRRLLLSYRSWPEPRATG